MLEVRVCLHYSTKASLSMHCLIQEQVILEFDWMVKSVNNIFLRQLDIQCAHVLQGKFQPDSKWSVVSPWTTNSHGVLLAAFSHAGALLAHALNHDESRLACACSNGQLVSVSLTHNAMLSLCWCGRNLQQADCSADEMQCSVRLVHMPCSNYWMLMLKLRKTPYLKH